jgi:ferredoxin
LREITGGGSWNGQSSDTAFQEVTFRACGERFFAIACLAHHLQVVLQPQNGHSAKIRHLNSLPQGQPQRDQGLSGMVVAMMNEHFGSCTNHGECEAVCPKEIPLEFIGKMNRDLLQALFSRRREPLKISSVAQKPSHEDVRIEAEGPAPRGIAIPKIE